jgi:hypothetical protein
MPLDVPPSTHIAMFSPHLHHSRVLLSLDPIHVLCSGSRRTGKLDGLVALEAPPPV